MVLGDYPRESRPPPELWRLFIGKIPAPLLKGINLDKKILAGAGLDVLEGENLVMEEKQLAFDKKTAEEMLALAKDHILFSRDNVIFTPHIAFYSEEAIKRIMEVTADNINSFIKTDIKNVVKI